jgi:hypothetical protein
VAASDDQGERTDESSAAVVAILIIALIVLSAILLYGFGAAHWFGVGNAPAGPPASGAP